MWTHNIANRMQWQRQYNNRPPPQFIAHIEWAKCRLFATVKLREIALINFNLNFHANEVLVVACKLHHWIELWTKKKKKKKIISLIAISNGRYMDPRSLFISSNYYYKTITIWMNCFLIMFRSIHNSHRRTYVQWVDAQNLFTFMQFFFDFFIRWLLRLWSAFVFFPSSFSFYHFIFWLKNKWWFKISSV